MNDFTRLTPEQGFRVYGWMRTLFDLKGTELAIFAIVYSYTQNGGDIGGNRFFSEWTGAGRSTVIRTLDALEAAGMLEATETEQGKLKKYTISATAKKKIEEHIGQQENLYNHSKNETSPKMKPVSNCNQSQNETTTSPKMGLPPSQNETSNQTIKKLERKNNINNKNKINDNITRARELPPIVQQAMQPPEAPKFHDVYSAMRNLLVRPMGTELEKCAHAFYDLREQQGWSHDWKSHLARYAASWLSRQRNQPPPINKPRPCQPDDPVQDFGEIPW